MSVSLHQNLRNNRTYPWKSGSGRKSGITCHIVYSSKFTLNSIIIEGSVSLSAILDTLRLLTSRDSELVH